MNISVTQEQPRGGFHHCSLAGVRLELTFVRLMRPRWLHLQSSRYLPQLQAVANCLIEVYTL